MYHWLVMADSQPAAYGATVAAPFAVAVERARPHTKLSGRLALGHFVIDVTQGSLPAVLPFLKQVHALSYAQVAMIVLAGNLTSSLIQPLFGYLSDQIARRWILPVSIVVAGAAPPNEVPDLIGEGCRKAGGELVDDGFSPRYPSGQSGTVTAQEPVGGTVGRWDDVVSIICGTPPPDAETPSPQ